MNGVVDMLYKNDMWLHRALTVAEVPKHQFYVGNENRFVCVKYVNI